MGWRGWAKMVFHQPLIPVLPVAKELISKTKWTSSKTGIQSHEHPLQLLHPGVLASDNDSRLTLRRSGSSTTSVPQSRSSVGAQSRDDAGSTSVPVTTEPDRLIENPKLSTTRKRMRSLFGKGSPVMSKRENSGARTV